MTDDQLQQWVETISLRDFGLPFRHRATFNARLRATGGRYFMHTHHIEISPHQLTTYGQAETEKIIKHELCHYHLHLQKRGYRHRDADFKRLLAHVGGSRYCKSLSEPKPRQEQPFKYVLQCGQCQMTYMRKRKVNVRKYVCGQCRGKLSMKTLDNEKKS